MPTALLARMPADLSVSTMVSGADAAAFSDAQSSTAVLAVQTDTVALSESASVAAAINDADTASLVESQSQAMEVFQSDQAAFTEVQLIGTPKDESDVASLTDDQFIDATLPVDDDTALFDEQELAEETQRWIDGQDDTVVLREDEHLIFHDPFFFPPTLEEGGHFGGSHRLFSRYRLAAGVTVAVNGSAVTELMYPAQEDLLAYDRIYRGGYAHPVTPEEIDLLTAAGYADNIRVVQRVGRTDDPGP